MSLTVNNLQHMINNIHVYGLKWRIRFGETKLSNSINMSTRQWKIGTTHLEEVIRVVYLGTKLCSYNSSVERTKYRCNKGYALLGSLTAIGFNRYYPNPLTSATIWHEYVYLACCLDVSCGPPCLQ